MDAYLFEEVGVIAYVWSPDERSPASIPSMWNGRVEDGTKPCPQCFGSMSMHGVLDGRAVCPGDLIVPGEDGRYYPMTPNAAVLLAGMTRTATRVQGRDKESQKRMFAHLVSTHARGRMLAHPPAADWRESAERSADKEG